MIYLFRRTTFNWTRRPLCSDVQNGWRQRHWCRAARRGGEKFERLPALQVGRTEAPSVCTEFCFITGTHSHEQKCRLMPPFKLITHFRLRLMTSMWQPRAAWAVGKQWSHLKVSKTSPTAFAGCSTSERTRRSTPACRTSGKVWLFWFDILTQRVDICVALSSRSNFLVAGKEKNKQSKKKNNRKVKKALKRTCTARHGYVN